MANKHEIFIVFLYSSLKFEKIIITAKPSNVSQIYRIKNDILS